MKYISLIIVICYSSSGCGKKYHGPLGTCLEEYSSTNSITQEQSTYIICSEHSYESTGTTDPAKDSKNSTQKNCESGSAVGHKYTYSATGTCPTNGAMATCIYESKTSQLTTKATITMKTVYSGSGMTEQLSRVYCQAIAGSYTKL